MLRLTESSSSSTSNRIRVSDKIRRTGIPVTPASFQEAPLAGDGMSPYISGPSDFIILIWIRFKGEASPQ